jgi:hypothetical protein
MNLPPNVAMAVDDTFAAGDRTAAQELLPSTTELVGAPYARVLMGIIELSRGDLSALARYADGARRDWRDVLYWREHERSNDEPSSYGELRDRIELPPDPDHLD